VDDGAVDGRQPRPPPLPVMDYLVVLARKERAAKK